MQKSASFLTALLVGILVAPPSNAVAMIINDSTSGKDITCPDNMIMGAVVNSNGTRLDLRKFRGQIVINGNGNSVILESCESLTIVGAGNSVDVLKPSAALLIRQSNYQPGVPKALDFLVTQEKNSK